MDTLRPGVNVKDEGVLKGLATTLDFKGAGVTLAQYGGVATITIPGGGSGGGSGAWLSGSSSWDPPSMVAGEYVTTTVTVSGAVLGDGASPALSTAIPAGMLLTSQVTAADTVTVTLANLTGSAQNLAPSTLFVRVFQTATLQGSAAWDPPSLDPGSYTTQTVSVTGAALGDSAVASLGVAVPAGVMLMASVTAADTVTVLLSNFTGTVQDLASTTLTARVFH